MRAASASQTQDVLVVGVVFVEVEAAAGALADFAERQFAQASDLVQQGRARAQLRQADLLAVGGHAQQFRRRHCRRQPRRRER